MAHLKLIESNGLREAATGSRPEQGDGVLLKLQLVTIAWMMIECAVSLVEARSAHSPSLLAFGTDSLVELLSATVVLLQGHSRFQLSRKSATRIAGVLLFVLAGVVTFISIMGLAYGLKPKTSLGGIGIAVAALIVMPVLAWRKRRLARLRNNPALAADAVQSATCAYLAALTLVGLAANAWLHLRWIDPVASLIAVPILIMEGREAMRGETCGCC